MPMNRLAPRGGPDTQTTARRTESVQGPSVRDMPDSANAVGRGRRLAKRERVSVMAVTQVSVCPASSPGATCESEDAGRRLSRVPGNPLATRLSVESSPGSPSSGATPGSNRPVSRLSKCCGADRSTPSFDSIRNRLTAPRAMNQTLSGSSSFTGWFPAHGTEVPERAASSASDMVSGISRWFSPT